HIGSASLTVRARPLGDRHARLTFDRALPLRPGDRAILRDPGDRRLWGIVVLDPLPPDLRRRGAGAARAEQLAALATQPVPTAAGARRGIVGRRLLRRLGCDTGSGGSPSAGYQMSGGVGDRLRARAAASVEAHHVPRDAGMAVDVLADHLGLREGELVDGVVV